MGCSFSADMAPLLSPNKGAEGEPLNRTLILGFGNADRQDDGVAWHLLNHLAKKFDPGSGGMGEESFLSIPQHADLLFLLQLTPEIAETLAEYDRVCFIDAHTGSEPEDIAWSIVQPQFQTSPLTHHMTPATLLSLTNALYGGTPETVLVAVRGYEFGFSQTLSARTLQLAEQAERQILDWLEHG